MAKIGIGEVYMKTDTLQECDRHLKAVLDALASAKAKLGSIDFHSTWSCAEKYSMHENVQAELDDLCRIERECKNLEGATTYLTGKIEETAYEAMWKLDRSKSVVPSQTDFLAEVAKKLQGNSTVQIRMEKF